MKENKVYDYRGFKIQNIPYGSQPRWFIFKSDMTRFDKNVNRTLKDSKDFIDGYLNKPIK